MGNIAKPGFEVVAESNAERLAAYLVPRDSRDDAYAIAKERGIPCDDATVDEARRLLKVSAS